MQDIDELTQAINALEAQRAMLGDSIVDAALAPLRERLAYLEQRQLVSQQRRLVTVLFLDIANSTLISQGLEPEEVREIIGSTLKRLSEPINAYGGQVTQYMGDGFVAVFGLTRVHENDARQAVRAGSAILAESRDCAVELEHRYQLLGFSIRIGINTGRVVVGRFSEAESTLMGLTVSLASRMEQAALPGTLLVSQYTYQHIRGAFEVESLPPIKAKGFPQPVAVYRILAVRPRTFRTFTRGVEGIKTSLIGREVELHQLQSAFTRATQCRETQLVTVVGDAGVGKSRLLYEFDRWIARAPSRVLAFKARASPQTMDVPFALLRDMIFYRLGILTCDPIHLTRQRLVEGLSESLEDEPQMKAHFIGSLLGFDFSDSPYLQGVANDPKQLRERAHLYLTQYFTAVAGKMNTVVMLDDIHWADDPSVSFITHLIRECPHLLLLVVCLARPALAERFPSWGEEEGRGNQSLPATPPLPRSYNLALGPLSRQASSELLGEILRNVETLPDTLRERILDGADGNPFYLEEFIQALVDVKAIRRRKRGGSWRLDPERLSSLELPATLIALLEARLDSLNTSQRILVQQASVIGRVFWRSALQEIRGDKPIADAEMKSLSRRGFFYPQEISTFAGTEEYRFHHALLRDVAYQALLKSDRQVYHNQVAEWLIGATQSCGRAGEFAPVIAEHYESAGERVLSADWYVQSGTRARNQGAPAQARTFFDRALNLLPSSPPSPAYPDLELRWRALAGRDEVLGILCDTEARTADDLAMVAFAESVGDDHLMAEACYRQGYYLGTIGQHPKEREAYIRGLAAARRVNDRRRETLILGLQAFCEVRLGDLEAAAQTSAMALKCAEEVDDDEVLARTLTNVSNFYMQTGDMVRTVQLLEQQLAINRRTGNIEGELIGLSYLGYTYNLLGMPEEAISTLQRCIKMARTIGHRSFWAYGGLNLALAYLRYGNLPSALSELEQYMPELQAMNDVFGYAVGQIYAALIREQDRQVKEALVGFEQAAITLGGIGTLGNARDAEAGAARCLLALNDLEAAQRYVVPLWDYLQRQSGAGMEFPLLAYETCADFFTATGQPTLARRVVESGYRELMTRADRISLPEWRQSFLDRLPEHRRIQTRWQENSNTNQD